MKKCILSVLAVILLLTVSLFAAAEEEIPTAEFELDAYCENGSMLKIFYGDGTEEETGCWSFCIDLENGQATIGDVLADHDISGIEPVCEGDEFEGWLTFEVTTITDEYDFDEYIYTLVSDTAITTEELMALPLPETYCVYAAKWASIPAEEYYQYSEETEYIVIPSATLYSDDGMFTFQGEDETYESTLSVATLEPGLTLGEILELDSIVSITKDGAEFAGWMVYEVAEMETIDGEIDAGGEPCFEIREDWFTVLHGATVIHECISTEELKQIPCGELDFFIVALWN